MKTQNIPDIPGGIFDDLDHIFSNINHWLNFAEVKHGALLVFNTTIFLGIFSNFKSNISNCCVKIMLIILVISMFLSISSYFPRQNLAKRKKQKNAEQLNLLYYRDIATLSNGIEYLKLLYKYYYDEESKSKELFTKKEIHYANEIIYNSRITSYKYMLFKYSLSFSLISLFFLIIILFN